MKATEIMTRSVRVCAPSDTLARAAQIMWDHDCGFVPVLDTAERVVGVITDRDVCMAAYTQGCPLHEISVGNTMTQGVHCCDEGASLDEIQKLMRRHQIHRVPVVNKKSRKLAGLIAISDLARTVSGIRTAADRRQAAEQLVLTHATVTRPRTEPSAETIVSDEPRSRI